jgi:hypothetical protein
MPDHLGIYLKFGKRFELKIDRRIAIMVLIILAYLMGLGR